MALTEEAFHETVRAQFAVHQEAVRQGTEKEYSFLADQGVDYNTWLEHRHGWPVTKEGFCGPTLASVCCEEHNDGHEVPAEECDVCAWLIRKYEEAKRAQ